ncbi:MAG: mechanosensitive ion channel family protein [Candidatus Margulisiibacteriota bacterium]|jgi:small-conductance mechanosensitive channel
MLNDFWQNTWLNNSFLDYFVFLALFGLGSVFVFAAKKILMRYLNSLAKKSKPALDDFIISYTEKTIDLLAYYGVLYITIHWLVLSENMLTLLNSAGLVLITVYLIRFTISLIVFSLEKYWLKGEEDAGKKQSLKGILGLVRFIIWGLAAIFLLDNLGFKVSSILAGLGVGGIAVALAAQAVLKDFFSYLSIFFDKPFEIGDYIIVGDSQGTVENIGIKTTKVRGVNGEQLIFANSDLTNSRVGNYKRMDKRRVQFRVGVSYQTSIDKMEKIPVLIKEIISRIPATMFDRSNFISFGDYSLVIETVYFVLSKDYNKYVEVQQLINLGIKSAFEREGIDFAYPGLSGGRQAAS